jgi:hypothetical protein
MQAFSSATRPRVWALCLQHASRVSDESNLEEHLGSPLLQSPGGVLNCPGRRLAKQTEKSKRPVSPPIRPSCACTLVPDQLSCAEVPACNLRVKS